MANDVEERVQHRLGKIVQEGILTRYIGEALFPALLYRAGAAHEDWAFMRSATELRMSATLERNSFW